jgi:hypothetical protein
VDEDTYRAFKEAAGSRDPRISGGTLMGVPLVVADAGRPLVIVTLDGTPQRRTGDVQHARPTHG